MLVLFALNRQDPLNDKTALLEVAEFERAPRDFGSRAQGTFVQLGASCVELGAAVECVAQLHRETVELADGLYRPRFALPDESELCSLEALSRLPSRVAPTLAGRSGAVVAMTLRKRRRRLRADVKGSSIMELSVYCTGDWGAEGEEEHRRAVKLLGP